METVFFIARRSMSGGPSYPVYGYGFFTSYEEASSFTGLDDEVQTLHLHNGKMMTRKMEIKNQIIDLQDELDSL